MEKRFRPRGKYVSGKFFCINLPLSSRFKSARRIMSSGSTSSLTINVSRPRLTTEWEGGQQRGRMLPPGGGCNHKKRSDGDARTRWRKARILLDFFCMSTLFSVCIVCVLYAFCVRFNIVCLCCCRHGEIKFLSCDMLRVQSNNSVKSLWYVETCCKFVIFTNAKPVVR